MLKQALKLCFFCGRTRVRLDAAYTCSKVYLFSCCSLDRDTTTTIQINRHNGRFRLLVILNEDNNVRMELHSGIQQHSGWAH